MKTDREEAEHLRAENARLLAYIATLKRELFEPPLVDPAWGLSATEIRLFNVLARRERITKEGLVAAVWPAHEFERRDPNSIESLVSKMRSKLAPFDIEIRSGRHVGYWMDPDAKERIWARLGIVS